MSAWKARLRPASFRGLAFEVTASTTKIGRRTVRHEYPLRDEPAVEDLGRATREFRLDGYFVGGDYMARRDAFAAAVETAGEGVLVHPFLGRVRAVCEACEIIENAEEGGVAGLRLVFVESGELRFPTGASASLGATVTASESLKAATVADFDEAFSLRAAGSLASSAASRVSSALGRLREALGAPGAVLAAGFSAAARIDALVDEATTLLRDPGSFAEALVLAFEDVGDDRALLEFLRTIPEADDEAAVRDADESPVAFQAYANQQALDRLMARTALAEIAIQVDADSFEALDDAEALRGELADRLADEQLDDFATGPESLAALADLRATIAERISILSAGLARLETVDVPSPIPSVVLSYELYGTPDRADEIVERNKVLSPLFVAGSVRVLSE